MILQVNATAVVLKACFVSLSRVKSNSGLLDVKDGIVISNTMEYTAVPQSKMVS